MLTIAALSDGSYAIEKVGLIEVKSGYSGQFNGVYPFYWSEFMQVPTHRDVFDLGCTFERCAP